MRNRIVKTVVLGAWTLVGGRLRWRASTPPSVHRGHRLFRVTQERRHDQADVDHRIRQHRCNGRRRSARGAQARTGASGHDSLSPRRRHRLSRDRRGHSEGRSVDSLRRRQEGDRAGRWRPDRTGWRCRLATICIARWPACARSST